LLLGDRARGDPRRRGKTLADDFERLLEELKLG
jgi:hypothetical protein